ncbi:MAG: septum formation inhibitor Maf [Flavobacteriales bacterium]
MKLYISSILTLILMSFLFESCTDSKANQQPVIPAFPEIALSEKDAYWNAGKAEITSYSLEQARYGEIRNGEAVMVFVTEPFSISKQVKLDNPNEVSNDKRDILKLNFTRKFLTGIYPYSVETSVFLPYNQGASRQEAVKFNNTVQEWCGHTFTQFNQQKDHYNWVQYSYFESEGDHSGEIKDAIPEDELWTLIRMSPDKLPVGDFNALPGLHFLRFSHEEIKSYPAAGKLENTPGGKVAYSIHYPHNNRMLSITFNAAFPYEIESWEETYRDGWGERAAVLTTRGTKKARIMDDYWNHHANQDSTFRNMLKMN